MKIPTEPTPNLVQVTNIGKDTSQESLRDFFAFCGKIKDFELEPADDQQKALILFETEKAAKTAELLSNALVENNHIQVQPYFQTSTPTDEKSPEAATTTTQQVNASDVSLIKDEAEHKKAEGGTRSPTSTGAAEEQDKKTVSNIMAELLSSGYILGDQVLAKGIDFDHRYGVREKVQRYFDQIRQNLQQWNEQYRVTDKANQMEQRMGLQQKQKEASDKAQDWLQNNPTGQKVSGLISQFSQHITDLHNEARRLVSVRQQEAQQQQQHQQQPKTSTA
ncbi:hypothetical protein BCR42DRAFT_422860 [Absidia repens]|uniref:RRM domain-containing protein n=1 Tax=Absidia repens TaxID=90262 RepID=A0A1X2I7L5_9FUNG|nr:hypothetical protein BCR42DRAFT_422860 [Absidia repens]